MKVMKKLLDPNKSAEEKVRLFRGFVQLKVLPVIRASGEHDPKLSKDLALALVELAQDLGNNLGVTAEVRPAKSRIQSLRRKSKDVLEREDKIISRIIGNKFGTRLRDLIEAVGEGVTRGSLQTSLSRLVSQGVLDNSHKGLYQASAITQEYLDGVRVELEKF